MTLQEQYIAFMTILSREIKRFMRIWLQTLLPPVITITLYFIIFGNLIGSRIGQMGGFSYMEFVIPGLIMMAVITNSYSNVVSSFYGAKFQRFVEELLVSPTPNYIILWGVVMGGVCRGLLVGCVVTLVSTLFSDLQVIHPLLTVLIVIMTSVLFSLAGFINAVFANSFDDISIVPTFILTPLIYLGGVFYSTDLLPEFWANISKLNPMLYIVNAFRHGVLGVSDINIMVALLMVAAFTVVAYAYAMHLLNTGKRLRQ
ncbi:MAG: ABC-2 type transport system permease protein [Pseudohongiellaceae bacterium]|jgi:ABC-2 type transport system permease protein